MRITDIHMHTRETANALLSEELVDYIGSDAHRLDHRPPVIADGITALEKQNREEYAIKVLTTNPTQPVCAKIKTNERRNENDYEYHSIRHSNRIM